jgi:hypothetical protein
MGNLGFASDKVSKTTCEQANLLKLKKGRP